MFVKEVMTDSPSTCLATDSANEAARIMWECDCGSVPVVDAGGRAVGIVTDRDICMAAYFRGQPLTQIQLGEIMSKDLCTVSADSELSDAERLMQERQIRRLPVVDNGCLVGIVSLADIARCASKNGDTRARPSDGVNRELAQTIERISEPRLGAH